MSKLLKRLNDNQNKVADTNGIMKLQAWDDGIAQDLTNKNITATIANASGFLFDLDLVSNGTEIDLDFKDSQLQKLTPDTYFLEIKVTDEAGDISVFPTEGYATFTINKNLHATEGDLVPQITFDTVLADVKTAMDKKVADYVKTIAKGDTGPQGAPGANGKDGVVDYSKTVNTTGDQTVAGAKTFSSNINGNLNGNSTTATKLATARTIGGVLFDGTQNIDLAGVNKIGNQNTTGNAATATKLQTARRVNGTPFDGTADINVNAANDSNLVHTTGTEAVAGDKTFTGVTDIQNQKQYKASFSIGANTINLTRIGSIVYVNARIKTAINGGNSYGVIPTGFTPANNSVINFIVSGNIGSCLFQANQNDVWFPVTAPFDANMSGSYLTNDPLPSQ